MPRNLLPIKGSQSRMKNNSCMRRLVILLFAFLIPLQSAVAAIVSIAGMPSFGCEQTLSAKKQSAASIGASGLTTDCGCGDVHTAPAGGHGTAHDHACPHLGMVTIAMTCAELPTLASASAPAHSQHNEFDSIVLGVPSPPPTLRA